MGAAGRYRGWIGRYTQRCHFQAQLALQSFQDLKRVLDGETEEGACPRKAMVVGE
jgi:hypothetical protein